MSDTTTYRAALKAVATLAVAAICTVLLPTAALAQERGGYRTARQEIRARARKALGTPYRSGGTTRAGFDCSGFTRWTFMNRKNLPHSSAAQFDLAKRDGYVRIWKRQALKVGDLVFQKTTSARVGHVGVYIGNGRFISATSSHGVAIESLYDPYYWGPRWVGAVRLPVTMKYRRANA